MKIKLRISWADKVKENEGKTIRSRKNKVKDVEDFEKFKLDLEKTYPKIKEYIQNKIRNKEYELLKKELKKISYPKLVEILKKDNYWLFFWAALNGEIEVLQLYIDLIRNTKSNLEMAKANNSFYRFVNKQNINETRDEDMPGDRYDSEICKEGLKIFLRLDLEYFISQMKELEEDLERRIQQGKGNHLHRTSKQILFDFDIAVKEIKEEIYLKNINNPKFAEMVVNKENLSNLQNIK